MKKLCIFKCYAHGVWWYVQEVGDENLGMRYRIYRRRRWWYRFGYERKQDAICAVVNLATCGMGCFKFKVEDMK